MKTKDEHLVQAYALIEDPLFIYRVGKKIQELGLVDDIRNGLIIFLACLTAYLDDKVSILIMGASSSGKSTRLEKPIMLFPSESVIKRASFSRKAFAYGEGSLDKKILYINEYRGGREPQLLLRILQSDGAIAHEYTQGGKTQVVQRVGSPVVLTTTSEKRVLDDDSTRFLTIKIEQNPDQILAVLKASLLGAGEPKELHLKVWRQAIRLLASKAEKPFDLPGWFEYIAEKVPRDEPRAMRDWKRWLALVKATSLCRPQSGSRNKVTFADYCVAYQILNPALTATVHALSEGELAIQKTVSRLANKKGRAVTAAEVQERLGWNQSATYRYLLRAVKAGLIRYEGGTRETNVKPVLPIAEVASTFLPSPKRLLNHVRNIEDSLEFVDPFTGAQKRMHR